MLLFTKKPVTIEARQFDSSNGDELVAWITESGKLASHTVKFLFVETLEGTHTANHGDWIIKGVKGEFYPCKPDIFEMTYTRATES
jgi:hypothetical protein